MIEEFENYDLDNIITPVDADMLESLLIQSNYDSKKRNFVVEGFRTGFSLNYQGNANVKKTAPNLKLRVGPKQEIWSKIMKEVKAGRYAGPFEQIPFENYIQSPIGLVPKDKTKTRLIFHLSYPRTDNTSVNAGIQKELCTVKYPDFVEAIRMCLNEEQSFSRDKDEHVQVHIGKSDMSMVFRHVSMKTCDFKYLILKAEHLLSGKTFFFVDKCLPFGSSISCSIFQSISDSKAHLVSFRTKKPTLNYLDDYFFVALMKAWCNWQVNQFLMVCNMIRFPVSLEKTFWGVTSLTFLGFLIDTVRWLVCIPVDKIEKALLLIQEFMTSKKVTVQKGQKLCGFLNFISRCIIPGRAFTRRLYAMVAGNNLKSHHHVRVTEENRLDLQVWQKFLVHPRVFCKSFDDFSTVTAQGVRMYSDASRSYVKGCGAWCHESWTFTQWDESFMKLADPSIEYLELYTVTVAVKLWIHRFKNSRIYLFCDNMSVVHMVNTSSSKCKNCMVLLRIIALHSLIHNVRVYAKRVVTRSNGITDSLSRLDFNHFKRLCQQEGIQMSDFPMEIPHELWPIDKIWKWK